MKKIIKWLVCSLLLICCSLLVDVSTKITASAQGIEEEIVEMETQSSDSNSITIYGTVQWDVYNGENYPLSGYLFKIYNEDTLLHTGYLNDDGTYSYVWDVDSTETYFFIDVEILATDGFFSVFNDEHNLNSYCGYRKKDDQVERGEEKLIDIIVNRNDTEMYRAIQIIETMNLAHNYVEAMTGTAPDLSNVLYIDNDQDRPENFYNHQNNCIYLLPNNQVDPNGVKAFTDLILHEYGHYVQYEMGMAYTEAEYAIVKANPSHLFSESQLGKAYFTKELALKVAWIEGWATAFAMQVKNYCITQNESNLVLLTMDPLNYRVINKAGNPYNMENGCPKEGEGCEGSIVGVLWDIWDGGTGDDDGISMSFRAWWNLTTQEVFHEETRTVGRILTINEFVKVFYIYKTNTINTTNTTNTINITITTNATPINKLREILAVYSIEVDCIKNDHLGTYIEWIEEEIIDIYMITAGNTSGNYYNFSVESDYFPDEPLMIGFDGNGYFYYIECQIEERSIEAYEYKIYVTISGTGGYCWLIGENGTMVDACLRTDDGLVVPFTSIYNNETGIFYLYPTTNNINMIYVQDTEVKLEVKYKEYVYLKNQNSAL